MRKIISVVGDAVIEEGSEKYWTAYETGKALVDLGFRVQSGGGQGVMGAAFRGAHASKHYKEGDTLAILPSFDKENTNPYSDITVATGLDMYRNLIVANSNGVIAVGGGAGTLSEISFAWTLKRLIIAYRNVEGWSRKVAGIRMDERLRYPEIPEDCVYGANTVSEAMEYLKKYAERYNAFHTGILF